MSRFTKKKKEHIGLSPFALVFRGQKKIEGSQLKLMSICVDKVEETDLNVLEELRIIGKSDNEYWLNVYGLDNVLVMENIAGYFRLERNILSDVMNTAGRPKVEEMQNGVFLTLKILQCNDQDMRVSVENLGVVFNDQFLISFQEQSTKIFEPVRERIRRQHTKIRNAGHDYLAFALLDVVVDNYIYLLSTLGEKIEMLEDMMSSNPKKEILDKINDYKLEVNLLRKHIKSAKEMIYALCKLETEYIHDENRFHFKELQSNINEASDLSDSYREILYDLLNVYHTSVSTRLNEIMRVLTVISVIFIPITFIAGVYGTNFENIPELHWPFGYYMMWGVMILTILGMTWYFRRKKWF